MDVILLADGTRLFGVDVPATADREPFIVVRGDWLRTELPEVVERLQLTPEDAGQHEQGMQSAPNLLKQRIAELQQLQHPPIEHIGFLREQIRRLQNRENVPPSFYCIYLESSQVRRRLTQPPARRELAVLGVLNNIENMESIRADDLSRRLQKIDSGALRTHLPAGSSDPHSVGHRILLQADRLFGHVVHFVQLGGHYIPGNDAAANVGGIAAGLLSSQLSDLLGGLRPESGSGAASIGQVSATLPRIGDALPPPVIAVARDENADIVEISATNMRPGVGAAVRIDVYSGGDADGWTLQAIGLGQANMSEVTAERVREIAADPQIERVASATRQLGASNEFRQAIAMGATVEIALQRAQENVRIQLSESQDVRTARRYRLMPVEAAVRN